MTLNDKSVSSVHANIRIYKIVPSKITKLLPSRYFLEFKTRMGMRIYSDSAIDDFSMAPECFGLNMDPKELGDYNYYDPSFEEQTTPHPAFADKPCKFILCFNLTT